MTTRNPHSLLRAKLTSSSRFSAASTQASLLVSNTRRVPRLQAAASSGRGTIRWAPRDSGLKSLVTSPEAACAAAADSMRSWLPGLRQTRGAPALDGTG
jgi:hypothetical protein